MTERLMTFAQGEEIIKLLRTGFDGVDVTVDLQDGEALGKITELVDSIHEHLTETARMPVTTVLAPGQVQCYRDDLRYCAQERMGEAHKPHRYEYDLPDGSHGAIACEGLPRSKAGQPWPERPE